MDIEARFDFALSIATELSEYQMGFSVNQIDVERKGDESPVTIADKTSEEMFRKAVKARFPNDSVFGEEQVGGEKNKTRWVIDPIDGTRKFMKGLPFWGICIAFEVDSEVQLGVIAVPGTNKIWSAMKNKGAYCDGKKIEVDNTVSDLAKAYITMPSRKYFSQEGFVNIYDALQNDIEHDPGFLDAYSYGMLSDGRINAVVSCADKWWDIAAAVCIVEEAGGVFTNIQGGKPGDGGLNIASSKSMYEAIISFINTKTS
jgi:histidinol-phosphatase